MESLPIHSLLEFNPDTLEEVRKEFNLDKPGRVDEAIDILEDWVKKQAHFTKKDFSRDYLERTLIAGKGSVETAKARLDKLCTFKTLMPDFFRDYSKEEYAKLHTFMSHAHLPKPTPDHCRVYLSKVYFSDFDSSLMFTYYKYLAMASEYMKQLEYTNGYIIILDYTEANVMTIITKINIVELRNSMSLLLAGHGIRLKALHIVSSSKAVSTLVSILKQVLSEKLGDRIHSHKSFETMFEYVPKRILPVEYGGEEQPLKTLNEKWLQIFTSKESLEYLQEMNDAKTIESCRQPDKFAEDYVGMPGSFRSLSVD